jgi:hypothetical protein
MSRRDIFFGLGVKLFEEESSSEFRQLRIFEVSRNAFEIARDIAYWSDGLVDKHRYGLGTHCGDEQARNAHPPFHQLDPSRPQY